MDHLTPQQRSKNMSAILGKNTKPEMIVRKYLWNHGCRYRLQDKRLPGKPDIVLKRYRTCIFINGCFWHGHEGCKYHSIPKTNTEFWVNKVKRNQERDKDVISQLTQMGWHCITIWECELKPKKQKATLESLMYTLSRILLNNYHSSYYELTDNQNNPIAADETELDYH